jgi:hypothetical protein
VCRKPADLGVRAAARLKTPREAADHVLMAQFGKDVEEDLKLPRPPGPLRGEVQKLFAYYSNVPIPRTSLRFRFNTLQARFFSFRRQWEATLRKIEEGTYERHLFKAKLHEGERRASAPRPGKPAAGDLFQDYVEARRNCGQDTGGFDRRKLDEVLEAQRHKIREQHGCRDVRFRVVVEEGRAKLKATPVD